MLSHRARVPRHAQLATCGTPSLHLTAHSWLLLLCRRVSQVVLRLLQLAAASVHSHGGSDMQQMTEAHDRLFVVSSLVQGELALMRQLTCNLPAAALPQEVLPVCHAAASVLLTGGCSVLSSSLAFEDIAGGFPARIL